MYNTSAKDISNSIKMSLKVMECKTKKLQLTDFKHKVQRAGVSNSHLIKGHIHPQRPHTDKGMKTAQIHLENHV